MSKKDYELIAGILRETQKHNAIDPAFAEGWHAGVTSVAVRFADQLAAMNPRFDRQRFLDAC